MSLLVVTNKTQFRDHNLVSAPIGFILFTTVADSTNFAMLMHPPAAAGNQGTLAFVVEFKGAVPRIRKLLVLRMYLDNY